MTRQTTPARLTRYILSTGVNGFGVRVFVSFPASVERCLAVVQMASLLPSSTCCSLVTLPLPLATRQTPTHPSTPPPTPSLVGQSWHILLKCLVHTGDRLVCLNCGNEVLWATCSRIRHQNPDEIHMVHVHARAPRLVSNSLWSSSDACRRSMFREIPSLSMSHEKMDSESRVSVGEMALQRANSA